MSPLALTRRFLPYLRRHRLAIAAALGLSLISPVVGLLMLSLVQRMVDWIFVLGKLDRLAPFLIAYAALILVKLAGDFAFSLVDARIVSKIETAVRADLFQHLMTASPGSFRKHGVGDHLSRLSGDAGRVDTLIYSGPMSVTINIVSGLAYFTFLLFLSWKLTLCALIVAPFMGLGSVIFARRMRRASRLSRRLESHWMTFAEERLNAAPMVHAFDGSARECAEFLDRTELARKAEMRSVRRQAALSAVVEFVGGAGALLVLGVGALLIKSGELSVGGMIAFLGSVGSLYGPTRSLAKAWARRQRAAVGAARIAELLDTPSQVIERPNAVSLTRPAGRLEFRDIRFGYTRGPEILHGISLTIEPGERVAIVGASGAGKSTLAKLAIRLADPASGAVLIDGLDVRDITLSSLRSAVRLVFQDPYLVNGSVKANLRFGDPDAGPERVEGALVAARAAAFVAGLPGRLLAKVGPHGGWLSGGQRQRLALARALMKDAPVLILDEATAAVDSETEELIQDAVNALTGRRTIVTIAHRLSSVQRADRVIVIDEGRIVESGSPAVLLAGPTRCRELFAAQLYESRRAA